MSAARTVQRRARPSPPLGIAPPPRPAVRSAGSRRRVVPCPRSLIRVPSSGAGPLVAQRAAPSAGGLPSLGDMATRTHCTGTLLWHDVPFDDRPDAGLLECSDCGYIIATGGFNDDRHTDAPVLRVTV